MRVLFVLGGGVLGKFATRFPNFYPFPDLISFPIPS